MNTTFLLIKILLCNLLLVTGADQPQYFLTACAMIQNEMNVILEWIEFHRIQGVDHFVFVDDESTDDVYHLPRLYEDLGYPDLIEIIPQNFRKHQQPNDLSYRDYIDGQMQALNLCNTRLVNITQWLLMSDVDEFMFSPKYYTIANYLRNQSGEATSEVQVRVIRFGSNGVQNENRVKLSLDPFADRITVINDVKNENLLLTSRNSRRGPFPDVDADYEQRFNATCAPAQYPNDCQHAIGKSIWRPNKCGLAGVHYCEKDLEGGMAFLPPLEDIRINHYAFRSKEHIENLPKNQMGIIKTGVFNAFDKSWFSSMEDNSTQPYHEEVLRKLAMFPSVTVLRKTLLNADWVADYCHSRADEILINLAFVLHVLMYAGFFITIFLGLVLIIYLTAFRRN